ncbi:hypothetical protein EG626_23785 [Salmonella enterica]|nr:hypothetical protein [Salmonella enterica]EIL0384363.1 lipoprotein [Salmonella enterica]
MKRYLFVALIISILSGCQSYAALQAGCVQGNVEACNTLAQRNMMIGNAQAGLNGYNAQRLTEAQINALNAQANYYQQPIVTSRGQPTRCYQNPDHSVTCNAL